ncbi:amidophosphoribosyltransferase [Granulicella mallensis]|uniref:Amidophosphoribosyltransferase n=1 Tax=Granulicella mallensis (strain ATCC BAA-1857 / DSM 23137 / MP5ACTX8) TaxID=682795 RepID=G8NYG4_GRAMM|nr:amidophosphoribosyltransferase [Granulicella mallensis]AEU37930.1 amidophosphoribosyltransferase [Granulicella mallensis MP5ACTX8]
MCGIVGVFGHNPVSQVIFDSLSMLQHRGQDAAGIATCFDERFYLEKGNGLITEVFDAGNMARLLGNIGIGHVRYPTAGCASVAEAQPFYVNSPYGIVFAHNGNLTNVADIVQGLFETDMRHLNTNSDSEVMLNVFAHAMARRGAVKPNEFDIFAAVEEVHRRCKGGYAVVAMIAGVGMVAFRDLNGIRPLVFGTRQEGKTEYMIASETVALQVSGFKLEHDLAPGEVIFIDHNGELFNHVSLQAHEKAPCLFEYVYLARPDSTMDGASVYQCRINMGIKLAEKIKREWSHLPIDVIIPIPSTSRIAAQEIATRLNIPYRDAFVRNRYVGRTFIMPGQAQRKQSIRRKLNPIPQAFQGKNVMLVDDSIVRGTTIREIVAMTREQGAKNVYVCSAAPPVRYPNVYGIDMPARSELVANGKTVQQLAKDIGADELIFQDLQDLKDSITEASPDLTHFDSSVFDGNYVTGDVTEEYLATLEKQRNDAAKHTEDVASHITRNLSSRL